VALPSGEDFDDGFEVDGLVLAIHGGALCASVLEELSGVALW
jgi:hypothetical protein